MAGIVRGCRGSQYGFRVNSVNSGRGLRRRSEKRVRVSGVALTLNQRAADRSSGSSPAVATGGADPRVVSLPPPPPGGSLCPRGTAINR